MRLLSATFFAALAMLCHQASSQQCNADLNQCCPSNPLCCPTVVSTPKDPMGHEPLIIDTLQAIPSAAVVSCAFNGVRNHKLGVMMSTSIANTRIICHAPYFYTEGEKTFNVSIKVADTDNWKPVKDGTFTVSWAAEPAVSVVSIAQQPNNCMQVNLQLNQLRLKEIFVELPTSVDVVMSVFHANPALDAVTTYDKLKTGKFVDFMRTTPNFAVDPNAETQQITYNYCSDDILQTVISTGFLQRSFVVYGVTPSTFQCSSHPFNGVARGFTPFTPAHEAFGSFLSKKATCLDWQHNQAAVSSITRCPCTQSLLEGNATESARWELEPVSGYADRFSQYSASSDSVVSYRSAAPALDCQGTGQQCFYDKATGLLVNNDLNTNTGATADRYSPNGSYINHYYYDELPWNYCCNGNSAELCATYYDARPNENCSGETCTCYKGN